MDIISRANAQAQGLKFYCTGKPCKNGNVGLRRTSMGACVCETCHTLRNAASSARQMERYHSEGDTRQRMLANAKRTRVKNKAAIKVQARKYRQAHQPEVNERNRKWCANKPDAERLEYYRSKYYKSIVNSVYGNAKQRARKFGHAFDLDKSDIVIPDVCPVLGIPLVWGEGMNDGSPSLDRKVPSLGYTKGNVAVISNLANRIKSNATSEQVLKVHQYLQMIEADQFIVP